MMRAAAEILDTGFAIDDCWNRIGVRGDKSCAELKRHSHCRNCPTYSITAATLLDRDLPGHVASGWTSQFAEAAAADDADAQSVMVFRVGREWFALPTIVINEIVALRPIHSLPHRRSPGLLGLVNVRGELIIGVSIAQLLVGEAVPAVQGRLIVARHAGGRLAFPVDEVQHTHLYRPDDLKPVPATVARSASSFTRGLLAVDGRTVGCLDERLVFDALNRMMH